MIDATAFIQPTQVSRADTGKGMDMSGPVLSADKRDKTQAVKDPGS